ncbi:MAG: hypothetical protein JRJ85_01480 [Deltaproteobacteria bacterium]|nr:hypothetical protein [Deltaproteobacteria bacterium]
MLTPEEYIQKKPDIAWLYGLDVLEHCLQGDSEKTAYENKDVSWDRLDGLRAELEKHKKADMMFDEIRENVCLDGLKIEEVSSETGDLNIERYLDGNDRCFDEYIKEMNDDALDGVSVFMDMAIDWSQRNDNQMIARHRRIYEICLECEAANVPCRVIAAAGVDIPELDKPLKLFIVIKDYNDPIFPGLWGAFKTNMSTNDFLNVVMDLLVGTICAGNGAPVPIHVRNAVDEEEEIRIINGERVLE